MMNCDYRGEHSRDAAATADACRLGGEQLLCHVLDAASLDDRLNRTEPQSRFLERPCQVLY